MFNEEDHLRIQCILNVFDFCYDIELSMEVEKFVEKDIWIYFAYKYGDSI